MMKPKLGMTARTGEKCPKSGVWKAMGSEGPVSQSVSRGNKMPPADKKPATWRLIIMF